MGFDGVRFAHNGTLNGTLGRLPWPRRGSVDNAPARYWSISPIVIEEVSHMVCETSAAARQVLLPIEFQLTSQRLDRPCRTAASKEVVVAGKDGGIEDDRERGRWPVARVARHSAQSRGLQGGVSVLRRNLDSSHSDQVAHGLLQSLALPGREDPS